MPVTIGRDRHSLIYTPKALKSETDETPLITSDMGKVKNSLDFRTETRVPDVGK